MEQNTSRPLWMLGGVCEFCPSQWHIAHPDIGLANNFMTIVNMVYLSTLTDRVPILPAFMPMHVGADAPAIPFGEVFDIPRLASIMRRPLLEWHEIKDPLSTELEPLGCWSLWEAVSNSEPRPSLAPNVYSLGMYKSLITLRSELS
jgi:hypothetical protein